MELGVESKQRQHPKPLLFHTFSSIFFPACSSSSSLSFRRLCLLLTLFSFLTLLFLFTLLSTTTTPTSPSPPPPPPPFPTPIPTPIFDTLVHYALHSNSTHMSHDDLLIMTSVLRRRSPCNLLVFGLTPLSLLLRSLNHGGRSVFLVDSEYRISIMEHRYPSIPLEAYDVSFTTRVRDLPQLIRNSRKLRRTDCRAVQNLLYSECNLSINDLPNELYEVDWDVIVVDGPEGHDKESPGRAGAIFTAGVLARTGSTSSWRNRWVDVFVHDYRREVEKVSSKEFLCMENMVIGKEGGGGGGGNLAHFFIENPRGSTSHTHNSASWEFEFCTGQQNRGSSDIS